MKNIFIVGASSGIGLRLAEQLSADDTRVFGTYYKNKPDSQNQKIVYHPLDVQEENYALDFLPEQLQGFVYCPGSINLRPFNRIKPADFINDFNLQAMGAVKILQAILPKLKKSGNASIVLFSTVAVQTGFPFHSQVAMSKGAIEGLTRSLAAEFAPTIRVNCIAPSLTDTPLAASLLSTEQKRDTHSQTHPLKRIGLVDDMASMAAFLLSQQSGWITGQIMHVDGGISVVRK